MVRGFVRGGQKLAAIAPVALLLLAVGGCAVKHPVTNLVRGKQLFVTKCGVCHTLSHANTTGPVGPNLDVAFRQDRADGIKTASIEGLVDNWILLAQGLIGSIGALAFLIAFMYKIVAVDPRSVMEAKRWIGRIVFGTIGVEVAGTLTHAIVSSIPGGVH